MVFSQKEYNAWYRNTEHGQSVRAKLRDALSTETKMLYRAKRRAKINNLEFSLCKSDIIIPEFCPITGRKLMSSRNGKGFKENSPSLDRVDNTKGYTSDNIAVISMRANKAKSDLSIIEIENLYKYIKGELIK